MYFVCPSCKLYSSSGSFTCPICNCESVILNIENNGNGPEGYMHVEQVLQAGNAWKPDKSSTLQRNFDEQTSNKRPEQSNVSPFFEEQNEPQSTKAPTEESKQDNPFFTERDYDVPETPHPIEVASENHVANNNASLGTIRRNHQTAWTLQEFFSWCRRNEAFRKVLILLALVGIILIILGIWNNRESIFTGLLSGISSLLPAALFIVIIAYAVKKMINP